MELSTYRQYCKLCLMEDANPIKVEHIIELNTVQIFLQDAIDSVLSTESNPRNLKLPSDYVEAFNTHMFIQPPLVVGGWRVTHVPLRRITSKGSLISCLGLLPLG